MAALPPGGLYCSVCVAPAVASDLYLGPECMLDLRVASPDASNHNRYGEATPSRSRAEFEASAVYYKYMYAPCVHP